MARTVSSSPNAPAAGAEQYECAACHAQFIAKPTRAPMLACPQCGMGVAVCPPLRRRRRRWVGCVIKPPNVAEPTQCAVLPFCDV